MNDRSMDDERSRVLSRVTARSMDSTPRGVRCTRVRASEWFISLKLKLKCCYNVAHRESKMSRLSVNQSNVFERGLPEMSMICVSKDAMGSSDTSPSVG